MVVLHKFIPAWGLPDLSPFCIKLETYLRMAKVPYETQSADARKAPKTKLPFIEHEGRAIADSSIAIDYLKKKLGDPLDARLSATERAVGMAFKSMLEEHLYFVILYYRWQEEAAWRTYLPTMHAYGAKLGVPRPLRGLILGTVRNQLKRDLHGQGVGRHSPDEVAAMGQTVIAAVADFIGERPFLLGPDPTSFDATSYAFLASVMDAPFASPFKDSANERQNLRAYVDRMKASYWTANAPLPVATS
jgi:glutathione S-transferase